MALPMAAMSQNSYREALTGWLETNPKFSSLPDLMAAQFKPAIKEINQKVLKNPAKGDQLAEKYISEQMVDDVFDAILVPPFEKNMTADDIKKITRIMNTPEGKTFQEHSDQLETEMGASLIGLIMMKAFSNQEAFKKGELQLDPVEPLADCPKEYKDKFDEYFDNSGLDNDIFDQLKNLPQIQNTADSESARKLINTLMDYLKGNIKNIALNASYGTMTSGDLDFAIGLQKTPEYPKLTQSIKDLVKMISTSEEIEAASQKWALSYTTWLTNQGVQLNM